MSTQMTNAMQKAGVPLPSRMERIFRYVADHPSTSSTAVAKALGMKTSVTSSLLSQMDKRGMVSSKKVTIKTRTGKGWANMPVQHYTVLLRSYELLPVPKVKRPAAKKFAELQVLQPAPSPVKEVPARPSAALNAFVENLKVSEARELYAALHRMFGRG